MVNIKTLFNSLRDDEKYDLEFGIFPSEDFWNKYCEKAVKKINNEGKEITIRITDIETTDGLMKLGEEFNK